MGMQTGAVVSLGLRAVFTTAATATVVNLMGDLAGWPLSTRDRGRFAGVLLGLVTGVAAGALLIAHARTFAPVLPLVTGLLVIVAAHRTQRTAGARELRADQYTTSVGRMPGAGALSARAPGCTSPTW